MWSVHGCMDVQVCVCVCVCVCEEGPVHVPGLYIMDEFAAASRTGRAGLISKRLERCYLYRELEGLQEQQEEEEEEEERGGGAARRHGNTTATSPTLEHHPGARLL